MTDHGQQSAYPPAQIAQNADYARLERPLGRIRSRADYPVLAAP
jgi:hypothetical protein